jgi:hypothetical protein
MERPSAHATVRKTWIVAAVAALAAMTLVSPVTAQAATSAPSLRTAEPDTTGCVGYKYVGDETNNAANEGVYGDIRSGSITYGGTSAAHLGVWLGSDVADSSTDNGLDWIQGGYFIGSADGHTETGEVMYAELEDPTYPDGDLLLYPSYGLGNQFFESTMTTTTSGSYGLYYMFDNSTLIGEAYLLNPTDTDQQAVLESYGASSSAACPTAAGALFGTEGTADEYDPASEIFIIRHGYISDTWGTEISTTKVANSPYSGTWWQNYYAFTGKGS